LPHLDASFSRLLADRLDDVESASETIVGTWPDGTIAYVNPAYLEFARANGAPVDFEQRWGVGAQLLDSVPEPMRGRYLAGMAAARGATRFWETGYRCPTPTQQQRYRLRIYPLLGGDGLLHVHTLVWREPWEAAPDVGEAAFRLANGLIRQCADCRHVFRPGPDRWEMVASFIDDPPPKVTHGLCPSCAPSWAVT
jgi:hypothetical protein